MPAITELPPRIAAKIERDGDCWSWTAYRSKKGYGSVATGTGKSALAHRFVFELLIGPIPEGLELDHLCLNTSCVNPEHLEPVAGAENLRRRYEGLNPKPPRVVEPSPALLEFLDRIRESQARYAAASSAERAADDARRHRLHQAVGCRCGDRMTA